jgi:hypothetical protein
VDLEGLRRIGPFRPGIPRSQVTVPISPDGRVDDTVLFQDPADAAKVYYLPRYRLRVTPATGHYEITTSLVDGLWRMTFGLESFPAPEISRADAVILPHALTVSVSSAGQLARDYPVAEFTPGFGDTQVRPEVVLLLTLPERDALLRAFTRDEDQARLVVHRGITVAVPSVWRKPRPILMTIAKPDSLNTPVILPDLVINDGPNPIPEPIREFKPVPIPDDKHPGPRPNEVQLGTQLVTERHPDEVVKDQPGQVVQLEQVNLRQQLVVDQSFERLSIQPAVAAPMLQQVVVRDHRTPDVVVRDHRTMGPDGPGPIVRDHRLPLPEPFPRPLPRPLPKPPEPFPDPGPVVVGDDPDPEPRYLLVSTTQDVTVPLRFDVDAHPYLFPSGQPQASKGFATLVVPWPAEGPSSRNYVYFQDQDAGHVFYHFPDVFLIGQREEAPYGPELSFTVGRATDAQTNTERALALISVHLVPQTSPARLLAATAALAEHVPAGGGAPELRPALHPATCTLELPGGAITTHAPPDLVRGWWVSESFAFDDLRDVYAVLTTGGATSALLRGRVDVTVDDDIHQVPVELRLDRPAVPPLSWTEKPGTGGSVTVTLLNEGDVELTIPVLPAWTDGVSAPVTGALPAKLAPGATLDLTVTPSRPDKTDVTLDVSGVRVVVEPEQAVSQTLDRRVERLPREVKLITTAGGLGVSGDPERDLSFIGIQFEGVSGAALLDHTTLQFDAAVPVPLADWLLDRGLGPVRYRQTLIHVSGSSRSDTDWRSTDSNLLPLPQP